jgi:hypothetical protein
MALSPESPSLSRRQWLERMSVPALATVAVGIAATSRAAEATDPAAAQREANLRGARTYNIRDFGAKGDGATLDTAAVQAAIDACAKDGGGIVVVPAGEFVVGTIGLKSNLTLHLFANGQLVGSAKREDYHAGEGVSAGNGNLVLLYAANAENITIQGPGTITGRGKNFYTGYGDATAPAAVRKQDLDTAQPNRDRPHLIIFSKCKNVRMRDVFLTESAYHGVRILGCEQVRFDGVRIYNRVNLNNDGFHFVGCEYVQLTNCEVRCQDDACALFGSNKFVTITNCMFSTRWSIFRFGGGESQNITISNCLIYETYGCPVKIDAHGGRMENVLFSNIVMKDVTGPIGVAFAARGERRGPRPDGAQKDGARKDRPARPEDTGPTYLRHIRFSGIRATVVDKPRQQTDMPFAPGIYDGEQLSCITCNGVGDAWMEDITFEDIHVVYAGGGTAELAAKREIPQMAAEYFGVWNTKPFGPPAYGFYARHVKGLVLNNVRFEYADRDVRPAIVLDHVKDVSIVGLVAQADAETESVVRVIDSQDVLISASRVLSQTGTFLQVEGKTNEGIFVDGGDLRKAAKPLVAAREASETAVKVRA